MIKAVIFDIDGVLVDSFNANLKYYNDFFQKMGFRPISAKQYQRGVFMTILDHIKYHTKIKNKRELNRLWKLALKAPYPTKLFRLPKHDAQTLKKLKKRYKLAIVTNRVKKGSLRYTRFAKSGKFFKVIVTAQDIKKPKPHPEGLLKAVKELGVKPQEAVFVGDTRVDLKAARTAGMKFINFNKYSKSNLKSADATINNFKKLPEAVNKLSTH